MDGPRVFLPGASRTNVDTVALTAPSASSGRLVIRNVNGRTTVRAGNAADVQVSATRRTVPGLTSPEVRLLESGGVLTLEAVGATNLVFGIPSSQVDYAVDVPPGTEIEIQGVSGAVDVSGVNAPVSVTTVSGPVGLQSIGASATVRTTSGDVRANDLRGALNVSTISGRVRLVDVDHVATATTVSGDLTIEGRVTEGGAIRTTSGDVDARLADNSDIRVVVTTISGDISVRSLSFPDRRQDRRSFSGTLGSGGEQLTINTASGDVVLAAR